MGRNIYDTAKENLKYKKRSMIVTIVGTLLFIVFFSYWVSHGQNLIWPWYFILPIITLMFSLIYHYDNKIVKKDPILEEMEKLNSIAEDGSEQLEEMDLKEFIPKYRDDELV